LRAIKNKSVIGAVIELGRINGFPVTKNDNKITIGKSQNLKEDNWVCMQNRIKILNIDDPIIQKGTIDCFNGRSDAEIIKFYETI